MTRAPGIVATTGRWNLPQLARALGGEIAGGQVLCPGPGHEEVSLGLVIGEDET
jgi:hypothetical protein